MEFNVVITELENDRNWLINEREDILSELAEFKKKVLQYERQIEVGELINITDFENHPKYVAILKERDDLVSIINSSKESQIQPSLSSNIIFYAEVITSGIGKIAISHNKNLDLSKAIINKSNSGIKIQSIFKNQTHHNNSIAASKSLEQLKVQYKLININTTSVQTLQERLNNENLDYNLQVKKIYKVIGRHKSYSNAIIIVKMDTAAKLEAYPYLYYNNCRLRIFELFNLRQCSNCWDYSHYKSSCKNNARCKNCGETSHNLDQKCDTKCKACFENGLSFDHMASSYKCTTRNNLIYKEKSKSFLI